MPVCTPRAAALALLPLLAACGPLVLEEPIGSYEPYVPPTGAPSYSALYAETQQLRSLYANAPAAAAARLPTSGLALYEGTATIRVPTADSLSLLGEASVLANFNDDKITGSLGNFTSVRQGQAGAQDWDGTISLTSDTNQGINVTRTQYIRASTFGTLTSGGNVLYVDGVVTGDFHDRYYGDEAGLTASMQNGGIIRYNGVNYSVGNRGTVAADGTPAGLSIIAER